MIMKKLLRFVLVSFIVVLALPGKSNPSPELMGKISQLHILEGGEFILELYIQEVSDYPGIVITTNSGSATIDLWGVEIGDFVVINSSAYSNLNLNPEADIISFEETFFLADSFNDYISIGDDAGCDVLPIPVGYSITDLNYSTWNDCLYVFDSKLNLSQELPVSKGIVKTEVKNLDDDLLSGFLIRVNNYATHETYLSSEDGYYYPEVYCIANGETFFTFRDWESTYETKSLMCYPEDTATLSFTHDVPALINISGTVALENQSDHSGSILYVDPYGTNKHPVYYPVNNIDGSYSIDIQSGIYRVSFLHDHFQPDVNRSFSTIDDDQIFTKQLNSDDMVVNLISNDVSKKLSDSTYYLFNDVFIPDNDTLIIENAASLVVPLIHTIDIAGSLKIDGYQNNEITIKSIAGEDSVYIFNIYPGAESVCVNYARFEDFVALFHLRNQGTVIKNSAFTDNATIFYAHDDASAHIENCTFTRNGRDPVLFNLYDNSLFEFDNCLFGEARLFDIYNESFMKFDSCEMNHCGYSKVWDESTIEMNFCALTSTNTIVNILAKGVFDHCTFFDNEFSAITIVYLDKPSSPLPDSTLVLTNSVFLNSANCVQNYFRNDINGFMDYNLFSSIDIASPFHTVSEFGILSTVNNNNDSCDIYNNIFMDPLLKDDLHLTWNSPCINAGDPNAPKDPDSTITDMGAYFYDLTSLIEEVKRENPVSVHSYPNPATEVVTFDISHQQGVSGTAIITLYNLNGVPVATNYQELPSSESVTRSNMPLKNRGLATGLYVYTIEIPGQETVGGKLTVVK